MTREMGRGGSREGRGSKDSVVEIEYDRSGVDKSQGLGEGKRVREGEELEERPGGFEVRVLSEGSIAVTDERTQ
jgi:hypothetical protein